MREKNESLNKSIRATNFQENWKSDANSKNLPLPVVMHIKRNRDADNFNIVPNALPASQKLWLRQILRNSWILPNWKRSFNKDAPSRLSFSYWKKLREMEEKVKVASVEKLVKRRNHTIQDKFWWVICYSVYKWFSKLFQFLI